MNVGIESRNQERKNADMYVDIDDYYLANGKAKTIKHIVKRYGYTIPAAAAKFKEVIG